jgi:hypothetical protein
MLLMLFQLTHTALQASNQQRIQLLLLLLLLLACIHAVNISVKNPGTSTRAAA